MRYVRGIVWMLLPVTLAAVALSACGGGGEESATAGTDENTVQRAGTIGDISGTGPGPALRAAPAAAPPAGALAGRIICIDPGHAASTDTGVEPIGPGSAETKVKDPGGTSGVVTGVREPVVTLAIATYLRQMLEAEGATVVMTREGDTFSGGNRERAQVANQAGADLFIRIHCDGSTDSARRGVSTLYPALIPGWTDDIYDRSRQAAQSVQTAMVAGLGAPDLGVVERSDITGFNWADTPAILVETGFMSNPDDDALLNDPGYQQQVAAALLAGIMAYPG